MIKNFKFKLKPFFNSHDRIFDTVLLAFYDVQFDERHAGEISWHRDIFTFNKTSNGRIDLKNDLMCLTDNAWENDYYIGFGVGLPGGEEQTHVEMLSICNQDQPGII